MPASRKSRLVLGKSIRIGTIVIYLVWIAAGFYIFHHKSKKLVYSQYVISSNLPAGHRLRAADFTIHPLVCSIEDTGLSSPSQVTDKYLVHAYTAGKPLQMSDLSATPVIERGDKKMRYMFPLQKQINLVQVLNTDSHVDVCWKACVFENVRVLSVVGPVGQAAEYYAILEIPAGDDTKITGEIDSYRLILRSE
jgi:hypothetical protein